MDRKDVANESRKKSKEENCGHKKCLKLCPTHHVVYIPDVLCDPTDLIWR